MQGAETSKTMFPCWRRVHLHESASFKTIFERLQTNHKKYAKIDPKMTENTIFKNIKEWYEKTSKHITENNPNFQIWEPFWSQLLEMFVW